MRVCRAITGVALTILLFCACNETKPPAASSPVAASDTTAPSETTAATEAAAAPTPGSASPAAASTASASHEPASAGIYAFTLDDIDDKPKSLVDYRGKVVLIVNVASRCGFTPQYAGLEKLYQQYKDRGFVILGVPSNDFGGQEPGSNAEIKEFCSAKYSTTFPMLAKVSVRNGPDQVPLYRYLTSKEENGTLDAKVAWNFNKFLVGRDGRVIGYYASKVTPEDETLHRAIEAALAK